MADAVRVICPNLRCRSILSVPGHARGKTVRCRQCGMRVKIPLLPAPPAPRVATEPQPTDDSQPAES